MKRLPSSLPKEIKVVNSFLNKRFFRHAVQRFAPITVILLSSALLFGQTAEALSDAQSPAADMQQPLLTAAECETLLEHYYRTGKLDPQRLFQSFESVRQTLHASVEQTDLFTLYLSYSKLIAMLYAYDGNRAAQRYEKTISTEAPALLKRAARQKTIGKEQKAAWYVQYADYLYVKLALPKSSSSIAAALPVLYRKALLLNPDNTEALTKLACWHIFPADETTSNYNSFIESQEERLETLTVTDRFTAYLLYSIYYMKRYNSEKGRAYLRKAAALFPDHALLSHLYGNYKKGKFTL